QPVAEAQSDEPLRSGKTGCRGKLVLSFGMVRDPLHERPPMPKRQWSASKASAFREGSARIIGICSNRWGSKPQIGRRRRLLEAHRQHFFRVSRSVKYPVLL